MDAEHRVRRRTKTSIKFAPKVNNNSFYPINHLEASAQHLRSFSKNSAAERRPKIKEEGTFCPLGASPALHAATVEFNKIDGRAEREKERAALHSPLNCITYSPSLRAGADLLIRRR
jgi:hypothetical protein